MRTEFQTTLSKFAGHDCKAGGTLRARARQILRPPSRPSECPVASEAGADAFKDRQMQEDCCLRRQKLQKLLRLLSDNTTIRGILTSDFEEARTREHLSCGTEMREKRRRIPTGS